jgi:hypothetical protein
MTITQSKWVFGIFLIILVLLSHASYGHSIFNPAGNVPGRTTTVLKTGPCGGIARTATPKVLLAGSAVRVDWLETINHPGRYEFYLSTAADNNFQLIGTVQDDQNGTNDLPHMFTSMIQMPTGVTCDACTLQMIQVMTENPAAPTYYYSCADIQLSTSGSPTPTPAPTAGPTGPNPACNH